MDPFILSKRNIRTPRIIYGTAWKKADTARLVTLAIQTGFRGIDTACQPKHYNEAGVGTAVAASLGPLRDQDIGAGLQRLPGHVFALHLADQQAAACLDPRRKRLGVSERQHDRARFGPERDVEQFRLPGQAPGDAVPAEDGQLRAAAHLRPGGNGLFGSYRPFECSYP